MIPVNDLKRGFLLYQSEYEQKALEILRSGWYILGKEVESFEKEFANALGGNCFSAGVDNGLDAIHLGLLSSGIKPGDEIIMQANGYIATVLGILRCGAIPVFAEPNEYFNLSASTIERCITERTRAVLVTHLYGLATEMEEIVDLCKKYQLMLFEDCAQSHFSSYKGVCTGLFGNAAFFSFYPTKVFGGFGDGGAVVSRNAQIIEEVKTLRNYGSDRRYHNIRLGYNARLDELQAGLLRVKLKHHKEILQRRSYIAEQYLQGIRNDKILLPKVPLYSTHVWYQFVVRTRTRENFVEYMKQQGIGVDINWKTPPYMQPALKELVDRMGRKVFPITEMICNEIVSLPIMDYMEQSEIEAVIDAVNGY